MIDHIASPPDSEDDAMFIVTENWQELTQQLGLVKWIGENLVIYNHPTIVAYRVREHYATMPFLPSVDWFAGLVRFDADMAQDMGGHVIRLYQGDSLLHRVRQLFLDNPGHTFCSNRSLNAWVASKLGNAVNSSTISTAKAQARLLCDMPDADCRKYDKGRPELVAV